MQGFILDFFLIFKNKIGGLPVAGRNKASTFRLIYSFSIVSSDLPFVSGSLSHMNRKPAAHIHGIHPKGRRITKPLFNNRKGGYKDKIG